MGRKSASDGLPDDLKKSEGRALKALWDRKKPMAQATFAIDVLELSGGILPQFFTGMRPLRLDLAQKFAQHLGCSIADFSPRLAKEEAAARETVRWPFPAIPYDEIAQLAEHELVLAEAALRAKLIEIRNARKGQKLQAVPESVPRGRRHSTAKS